MLSAGALNSLFFGVYGVSLRFMTSLRSPTTTSNQTISVTSVKPTNWEIFWAGCAGGMAQLVVACPVDVAKIKLQTQTGLIWLWYPAWIILQSRENIQKIMQFLWNRIDWPFLKAKTNIKSRAYNYLYLCALFYFKSTTDDDSIYSFFWSLLLSYFSMLSEW